MENEGKTFGSAGGGINNARPPPVDCLASATAALENMLERKFDQAIRCDEPGLAGLRLPREHREIHLYLERLAAVLEMVAETGLTVFSDQDIHRTITSFLDACRQNEGWIFSSQLSFEESGGAGRFSEPAIPAVLWLTDAVWGAFRHTGNTEFAANAVPVLRTVMEDIPRHEKTGLISGEQPDEAKNVADFLFRPSLLFAQACHQMAELMNGLQEEGLADSWHYRGQQTEKNIRIYFWNKKLGMFRKSRAAMDLGDVHGSALSVYRKTATSGQLMTVARQFSRYYDTLTDRGAIRQLLSEEDISAESTASFDEDASTDSFSSVAAGWFAYALDFIDHELAEQVLIEVARNLLAQEAAAKRAGEGESDAFREGASVVAFWDRITAASRTVAASRAIQERRNLKQARVGRS